MSHNPLMGLSVRRQRPAAIAPRYQQGVVFEGFGWWLRLYVGSGFSDRPRAHFWTMGEHHGITLRTRRGYHDQPVVGVQWRRSRG